MKKSHKVVIIPFNKEKPTLVVTTRMLSNLNTLAIMFAAGSDNVLAADFIMSLTNGQIVKSRYEFGTPEFLEKVTEAWGYYKYHF